MKTILKQYSNSRQIQDIVPVSNLKARKIKTLLSLLIHLDHHQFAAAAVAPSIAPPVALLPLLLLRFCLCRSCCCYAVDPAVAPAVTPLLLLGLFTVVASRGRIRVTVSISDCWALWSSYLEGCSTS